MKQVFDQWSAKAIFLFGIAQGILVLCTIGFFIMLGVYFHGGSSSSNAMVDAAPTPTYVDDSAVLPANIQLAAITDQDYYKGGKDAKVVVVEFSDTECPFCKRFHETMNQVVAKYGADVKWVYKHAPLDSLHRKARNEAMAVECAGELGGNAGFWKYLDQLFFLTPSNDGFDAAQLPQVAADVGLNRAQFESCLASGKYAQKVQNQLLEAEAAGLQGTPYAVIMVGEQKIPVNGAVPFEQMVAMIDQVI
ncbi:MAG TPA: thioredoxin domain-containing protein [Candidatus Kapabacteria bacterium]|nr:thioredoxin domain-containing protein [Candidatus Kapabacteria bacterium]